MLTGLPAGQRIFYRVLFQDLSDIRSWSLPTAGSFSHAAGRWRPRDVTIAWSADTVGQGWGINPEWGGLRLYETMSAGSRMSSSTAATRSTPTSRYLPK